MRLVAASSLAVLAVLAACSGGGGGSKGPTVGENPLCDPVAQTGCSAGWKCTWIQTGATSGSNGCVPAGAHTAGQTCTWGAQGATTGFDDCAAGLACLGLGGTCTHVCNVSTFAGCGTNEACEAYASAFGASPTYGGCAPQCDPLTQVRLTDGAAACGSADPAAPTLGCFGMPSQDTKPTVFTCGQVLSLTNTHRTNAAIGGQWYVNSCAPGYLPLLVDSSANTSQVDCIALCRPSVSYAGNSALRQGVSPYSCPDAGATATTEECRYWWMLEGGGAPVTSVTNDLGFCFDYTKYTNGYPPAPDPSCATLSLTDANGDGVPDYLEWGCGPHP